MITPITSVSPSGIFRFFGAKSAVFSHENGLLTVKRRGERRVDILMEKLIGHQMVKNRWFYSALSIPTEQGVQRIFGLSRSDAKAVSRWLSACGYQHIFPEVERAAKSIAAILAKGYLRTSHFQNIQSIARRGYDLFRVQPNADYVSAAQMRQFSLVDEIAHWKVADLEAHRSGYLQRMKEQYADYFDTVESNPLTEKQRDSCVIDEDNNLVLAGAGTGKTSVMIGRVGFLLKSEQALPSQILMLAFANKAAVEMQERLDERLECDQQGVTASTFHKLGKNIIAQVEGGQPSISAIAGDDRLLQNKVNKWFEIRVEDDHYRHDLFSYFTRYLYPIVNPFDFDAEGDYFEYIKDNEIRTLKGETVKSVGECLIANHLFMLGVEYQYEADYKIPTRSLEFRQYAPDFYLPEDDIYIEFYGTDREGNTASYVDRDDYHAGIEWKRQLHKDNETNLIELYHYENTEGVLNKQLQAHLTTAGVEFNPLPKEEALEALREFGAVEEFAVLLSQMLRLYRSSWFNREKIELKIQQSSDPGKLSAALELLLPIIEDYENYLHDEGKIDFDDMIGKALSYVKAGKFKPRWRFILVDEFQDISDPRAQLVEAIKQSNDEISLFCVGDDWQAIYRFTGSDIDFTNNFEAHFGATKTTVLDKAFRFNNSISDIASRFVQENPAQLRKNITTLKQVRKPAVALLRRTSRKLVGESGIDKRLRDVLDNISKLAGKGSRHTVYLIARYGFILPEAGQITALNRQFPHLVIENQTMHASKGKEADYVVVLGLSNGKHGFPSRKVTHPLVEALLPKAEAYVFSEERRLFYVALTRARQRVYLITDMAIASDFVVELIANKYPIELKEFEVSLIQQLLQHIRCMRCSTGSMVFRIGGWSKFKRFLGCSNFPLCKHIEEVCEECGQAMEHAGRFRVCIDPRCRSWVPKCGICNGDMALRNGKYGKFWSCCNWRSEGVSCQSTENVIVYDGLKPTP